jgi:nucleotide-binding universal stress UspA family protein
MPTVLLAIDDDESHVERQIRTIADLPFSGEELTVTILHVFSENPSGASVNQLKTARLARDRLEEAGLETSFAERSGDPAAEVLEHAEEADVALICVAGRKRSPTGKALFGSVTQNVILNAERPVLVAGDLEDEFET